MKNPIRAALWAGLLLLSVGTARAQEPAGLDSKALLTQDQVIAIAKAEAQAEKIALEKFILLGCHYEFTGRKQTWTVFFEQKPPTPAGGHFLVWVNDRTGKATLMRGE